jgi:hypothetical protein
LICADALTVVRETASTSAVAEAEAVPRTVTFAVPLMLAVADRDDASRTLTDAVALRLLTPARIEADADCV